MKGILHYVERGVYTTKIGNEYFKIERASTGGYQAPIAGRGSVTWIPKIVLWKIKKGNKRVEAFLTLTAVRRWAVKERSKLEQ